MSEEGRPTSPSSGQATIDSLPALTSPCLPLRGSVGPSKLQQFMNVTFVLLDYPAHSAPNSLGLVDWYIPTNAVMARSGIQFQKGPSLPEFLRLYGSEEQC